MRCFLKEVTLESQDDGSGESVAFDEEVVVPYGVTEHLSVWGALFLSGEAFFFHDRRI